jgi:hypothetical protein
VVVLSHVGAYTLFLGPYSLFKGCEPSALLRSEEEGH